MTILNSAGQGLDDAELCGAPVLIGGRLERQQPLTDFPWPVRQGYEVLLALCAGIAGGTHPERTGRTSQPTPDRRTGQLLPVVPAVPARWGEGAGAAAVEAPAVLEPVTGAGVQPNPPDGAGAAGEVVTAAVLAAWPGGLGRALLTRKATSAQNQAYSGS